MPRPLTSFIGRDAEVAAIVERLNAKDMRLLTLTGPGGVGKTRLAIRAAEAIEAKERCGVCFVPLAPVHDPALVVATIGSILGVDDTAAQPVMEGIVTRLGDRPGLLILDNLEHVLPAAPLITDLLAACPNLTVLATSRAVLRLSGERVFAVSPLPSIAPDHQPLPTVLLEMEAVRLFTERAAAASPGFVLNDDAIVEVATLCARLDGLPLAIELAAARTRMLSPRAMLQRLDQQLHLLTAGARDQPMRLRSMRDAVAWSYDLLSPSEQELFNRLSVFAGGFTLHAATAVANSHGAEEAMVMTGIASLLEQSLVHPADSPTDDPRFSMLETVRHFARDALAVSGASHAVGECHAAYYLGLVEQKAHPADPYFAWGPHTPAGIYAVAPEIESAKVELEQHNIRAALNWLAAGGRSEETLRLATASASFFQSWGQLPEARIWLERALANADSAPTHAKALAFLRSSIVAVDMGNLEVASTRAREALAIWQTHDDSPGQALALQALGMVEEHRLNWETAIDLYESAIVIWRRLGEPAREGILLSKLGGLAYAQERFDHALALELESLALLRDAQGLGWLPKTEWYLGMFAASRGEMLEAARYFRSSFIGLAAVNDTWMQFKPLVGLADVAAHYERPESSVRLLGAVDRMLQRLGGRLLPFDRPAYERADRTARAALGEDRFAAVHAAGARLTGEELRAEFEEIVATAETAADGRRHRGASPTSVLTARELDVLRLVAQEKTDREIGGILFLSRRTVNAHVSNILAELNVPSRKGAVKRARELGLLESATNASRRS